GWFTNWMSVRKPLNEGCQKRVDIFRLKVHTIRRNKKMASPLNSIPVNELDSIIKRYLQQRFYLKIL
ncbi:hypothetical protein K8R14_01160, partial [bacterium]|nr:hypothetical protein [bacterium]